MLWSWEADKYSLLMTRISWWLWFIWFCFYCVCLHSGLENMISEPGRPPVFWSPTDWCSSQVHRKDQLQWNEAFCVQGHRDTEKTHWAQSPALGYGRFLLKDQMLSAKLPGLCGLKVCTERLPVIFAAVQQTYRDDLTYPFILSSLNSLLAFASALGCHLFYCPSLKCHFVSDLLLKQPVCTTLSR